MSTSCDLSGHAHFTSTPNAHFNSRQGAFCKHTERRGFCKTDFTSCCEELTLKNSTMTSLPPPPPATHMDAFPSAGLSSAQCTKEGICKGLERAEGSASNGSSCTGLSQDLLHVKDQQACVARLQSLPKAFHFQPLPSQVNSKSAPANGHKDAADKIGLERHGNRLLMNPFFALEIVNGTKGQLASHFLQPQCSHKHHRIEKQACRRIGRLACSCLTSLPLQNILKQ